jgi:hypothetical protein
MPPLAMFLNSAFKLYRHNTSILPFVSNYSLAMMPQLNPAKATRIINDAFFQTCSSLFFSATETLVHQEDVAPKYQAAFEMLWKNTTRSDVQFQLLSFASHLKIDVIEKIQLFFNESTYRQMTTDSLNVPFISALIYLICVILRYKPQETSEEINKYDLISRIVTDVMTTDTNRLENFDSLACAVLQFVITTIEWGVNIYTKKETLAILFQFIDYIRTALRHYKKSKKDKNKKEKSGKDKDSGKWVEKNFDFIKSSIDDICGRINIHLPSKDFFTRRANSSLEINEESIATLVGLKEHSTRFFSVQHNILVSFIENNDGTGPLILMSRGPHGKAIFIVEENLRHGSEDPQLASVVQPEALPPIEKVKATDSPIDEVDDLGLVETIKDIDADDQAIRTRFASTFDEWLDISKLSYVPNLIEKQPFKRPRVIDFVTKMGYLIGNDSYSLRTFNNIDAVHEAIRQIDMIDSAFFTPVVITHVLPTDRSLNVINSSQRMTPLMSKFLHEIAEPMSISDAVAEASGLPLLKSSVPCVPLARGYIAYISAALTKDESQASKLKEVEPLVKIIFNETDYDIKLECEKKPSHLLLVIRPKGDGLYHVAQVQVPSSIYTSFSDEQVLTANTIAFNITTCIEQITHSQQKLYPRTIHQKEKIFRELETTFGITPQAATVVDSFN